MPTTLLLFHAQLLSGSEQRNRGTPARPARRKVPVNPTLRKGIGRATKVLAGIALVLTSTFLSAMVIVAIDDGTGTLPTGDRPLKALRLEPDDNRFDVEEIRRNL